MALLVKTGTYTGDGSDPQTITGVGFTPKVVMIMGTTGVGSSYSFQFKTTEMATGSSGVTAQTAAVAPLTEGLIDSFTSDGFLVRGAKNINTRAYYYIALAGDECVTGTYTGNATDNRDVSIGMFPKWVMLKGNLGITHKSTATGNTTDISQLLGFNADVSNFIQNLNSDGFQIGNNNAVNASGVTFYYFAIKGDNVTSGTYTGNATDNRDITGVGFDPIAVFIKSATNAGQAVFRTAESGDLTSRTAANNAPIANAVQSYITDGFQIGTDATVNSNTVDYFWVAFGRPTTVFNFSTGSHAYTGITWNNLWNRFINFTTGAYTYTGVTWNSFIARVLAFATGAYAYTGYTWTMIKSIIFAFGTGAYTYSGVSWLMKASRRLAFATGSYVYTGVNWFMSKLYEFLFGTGNYTYTGISWAMRAFRRLAYGVGSYTYTGVNWLMSASRKIVFNTGVYTYSGISWFMGRLFTFTFGTGSYTYNGVSWLMSRVYVFLFGTGSYIIKGFNFWKWKNNNKIKSSWGNSVKSTTSFTNQTKGTSTFSNQSKGTSTFSNQTKDSSSWTNQNKEL
jgi:hypothetical protein